MREILSVQDLSIEFGLRGKRIHAIRNCSLDLYPGESLAIVGESGSGKSVFTKSFLGMLDANGKITSGKIMYGDKDLATLKSEKDWIQIRGGEISMVFQDPMTALNPLMSIGAQIRESIELHSRLKGGSAIKAAIEMLNDVGIDSPEKRYKQYPHEFSGGMRQRAVIAAALACRPKILICDEPTTALDVTIQAQIMALMKSIKEKYNLTVVYITHDLGVVANVADRVAVMYAGEIIEIGAANEIFYNPKHPYTWALLSSLPQLGMKGKDLYTIKGTPPNMLDEIKGDAFAPRNPLALEIDFIERPPFFEVSATHRAKTWLLDDRAPKTELPEAIRGIKNIPRQEGERDLTEKGIYIASAAKSALGDNILELRNVSVVFGASGASKRRFKAVNNVSFSVRRGETFGLVGESGSGKTTIGRAVIRINPVSSGEIVFKGEVISGKIGRKRDKELAKKIQMIFQDPLASLNERAKVDYIVSEGLYNTGAYKNEAERVDIVNRAMLDVGLLPEYSGRFPHEFSGGQRQRIGIARALVMAPELIIADEPISALDVSIRAQVLNLLNKLQKKHGFTYLFIAHDLSVMRYICDRIAVISKGVIVEMAETEELFANPAHPYTQALLSAIPQPDPEAEKNKKLIVYNQAAIENPPPMTEIAPGHYVMQYGV